MTEATHTLEDEFRTPDRVRAHVMERIVTEAVELELLGGQALGGG